MQSLGVLFMSVELINKVGVDRQIADEGMAIGEGEDFLFTLLADQTPNIFKAIRACLSALEQAALIALAEWRLIRPHKPIMERSDSAPRVSKAPWAQRAHSSPMTAARLIQ